MQGKEEEKYFCFISDSPLCSFGVSFTDFLCPLLQRQKAFDQHRRLQRVVFTEKNLMLFLTRSRSRERVSLPRFSSGSMSEVTILARGRLSGRRMVESVTLSPEGLTSSVSLPRLFLDDPTKWLTRVTSYICLGEPCNNLRVTLLRGAASVNAPGCFSFCFRMAVLVR